MKLPRRWLAEYVAPCPSAEALVELLLRLGFETERIEQRQETYAGILAGQVREVGVHLSNPGLRIVQVGLGDGSAQIVCGAPNLAVGMAVAVATPGAYLPDGRRIDAETIGGVASMGMLCSAAEMGVGVEGDVILTLGDGARPGQPIAEVLDLADEVLELEITPNRPDCLSVVGIARDVAAALGARFRPPRPEPSEQGPPVEEEISVAVGDHDACPRYMARVVEGVRVGPSPGWLVSRLLAAGQKPINNVVDITNFVLLELGHPLHAFDLDRLGGAHLEARDARPGERLTTLDDVERTLAPTTLVIADRDEPVALAGIMGGVPTQVTSETSRIALEGAVFRPGSIRRTSRALGLATESSYRFERGVDPHGPELALARAAELIHQVAGGRVARGAADAWPRRERQSKVGLRPSRVNALLGTRLRRAQMHDMLERLGCAVDAADGALRVRPPSFRRDLQCEVDLIEEIARLYGYDRIASRQRPCALPVTPARDPYQERAASIELMTRLGFTEVMTSSLNGAELLDAYGLEGPRLWAGEGSRREMPVLRPSLLPGLVEVARHNLHRHLTDLQIFDLGVVFAREDSDGHVSERYELGAIIAGRSAGGWSRPPTPLGFFDVKGTVEALLDALGIEGESWQPETHPMFEPLRSAVIAAEGAPLVTAGALNRSALQRRRVKEPLFGFVMDWDRAAQLGRRERRFNPLPKFPPVFRDVAFVVGRYVTCEQLLDLIRTYGGEILEAVELFDHYTGPQVPPDKKSLAFALQFRSPAGSLAEATVDEAVARIVAAAERTGAKLRGI